MSLCLASCESGKIIIYKERSCEFVHFWDLPEDDLKKTPKPVLEQIATFEEMCRDEN